MRARYALAVAALPLALAACGSAAARTADAPTTSAVTTTVAATSSAPTTGRYYTKADALARAYQVLDTAQLPPGGTRLKAAPLHRLSGPLEGPGLGIAVVDGLRWWRVPGTQAQFAAYETAHPPRDFTFPTPDGFIDGRLLDLQGVAVPGTSATAVALLNLYALQVGDHVDVLLDAAVEVNPHRTPLETIPGSVTTATLAYDRVPAIPSGSTVHRHRTLTAAEVQQLARALNTLAPYPGFPDCPAVPEEQEQSTLKLSYGEHQIEFDIAFGCGGVNVLVDGAQQPFLDNDDAVAALTLRLLHVKPFVYS